MDIEREQMLAGIIDDGERAGEQLVRLYGDRTESQLSPSELDNFRELTARQARGRDAAREVFAAYERDVVALAKRRVGRGLTFEELRAVGDYALLNAVVNFDFTWRSLGSTEALFWISQAMAIAMEKKRRTGEFTPPSDEFPTRQKRFRR